MIRSHCNQCLGERNHDVLHEEVRSYREEMDEYFSIDFFDKYILVQCRGCDSISLRIESSNSEQDHDDTGFSSLGIYPPAVSRKFPGWGTYLFMSDIQDSRGVMALLKEIYVALHNKLNRLALMGIRALTEQVMLSKIIDQGNFAKNLLEFKAKGHISQENYDSLESALQAGHAAIHRAFNPGLQDVVHALDIVENIMEAIYANSFRANELNKRVPERVSRKK